MKNRTCCFTGHRYLPEKELPAIKKHLTQQIQDLIKKGVIYFGCGGALGFDMLCEQLILELKQKYPHIYLILVLPCHDQAKFWNENDIQKYNFFLSQADKIVYISERYYNGCMQKRNRHLVDNSGYCICYLRNSKSGTKQTVDYALKSGVNIIYI